MPTWFRARELHDLGLNASEIRRRVSALELHRLAPDLYSLERPTPKEALLALQTHYPSLVFTGETALSVYASAEIVAPARGYVSHQTTAVNSAALIAKRSRRLSHELIDGLRLTNPLRAGIDATDVLPGYPRVVERHYLGSRGRSLYHHDLQQLSRPDRNRSLALTHGAVIGASSEWERRVYRELVAAGLTPVPNFPLGPYHWDLGFPDDRVAVDLDSWKFHGPEVSDRTFILDRWKTNHAVRQGWLPLRFTDLCTNVMLPGVIAEIRNACERQPASDQPVWQFHPNLY